MVIWSVQRHGGKRSHNWRCLVVFLFNIGARRSEFLALKQSDFNLDRNYVMLFSEKTGKLEPKPVNETLREHVLRIQSPHRQLMFPFPRNFNYLYRQWYTIQEIAGVGVQRPEGSHRKPYYDFHELRKTCGTNLYEQSPAAAQGMLGHSSVETTRRSYANVNPAMQNAANSMKQPTAFSDGADGSPPPTLPMAG